MTNLRDLDRQHIWHPFTPFINDHDIPLIKSAKGVYLETDDGRKIIDGISSWWVNVHGHSNDYIAKAIAEQASKLAHVIFAGFTHEPAIRLSENLLSILPENQKKIFYSDNGSTSTEVAIKLTLQYWHNIGKPRKKIIAIEGSYHGDTFGAMSVGERGLFTEPFNQHLFDALFIPFPTAHEEQQVFERFRSLIDNHDVAGFIFEPLVQGAAGMRIYTASILDKMISYAQQHDVICIADEVFTGFGRTGKLFASNHLQNKPNLLCLSKGITGGTLPLGVTSCDKKIVEAFSNEDFRKTFFHGHSYTGNPIICAAANASFELLMRPDCQQKIQAISKAHTSFQQKIKGKAGISDIRTLGTILAIELDSEEKTHYVNPLRKRIYPFFLQEGILLRPLGNIIYVLPPYVIEADELDQIYTAIEKFLDSLQVDSLHH